MSLEPPGPCIVARGCAEDVEVVVLGIPTVGTPLDRAQHALELHDSRGLEVALAAERSFEESVRRYTQAAEQGESKSQNNLGLIYETGRGVLQNYQKAAKWYKKAAEQGNPKPQNNLGIMYSKARGVPQNYVEAHKWLNLAASRLGPGGNFKQAKFNRDRLERKMNPDEIAQAQKLAREWRPNSN